MVKRAFFLSVVLAAKYNDDLRLNNRDFAKIGGLSVEELLVLEMTFL